VKARGNTAHRGVPGTPLCRNDLPATRNDPHNGAAGQPSRQSVPVRLLRFGSRPPAGHRRGRSPSIFRRATMPMVRRWNAEGGPEGRGRRNRDRNRTRDRTRVRGRDRGRFRDRIRISIRGRGRPPPGRAGLDIVSAPAPRQRNAPRTMSCRATLAAERSGASAPTREEAPPREISVVAKPSITLRSTALLGRRWAAVGGPEGRS